MTTTEITGDELSAVASILSMHGIREPATPCAGGRNSSVYAAGDVIIRVAPPSMTATKAAAHFHAVRALAAHGVPVTDMLSGPVEANGRFVFLYDRAQPERLGDWEAIGAAVRHLHSAPLAAVAGLPPTFDLSATTVAVIDLYEQGRLPAADAGVVLDALDRARPLIGLPLRCVHGDLWPKNLMAGATGPVFIDFDSLGPGDPNHDLALLAASNFYELRDAKGGHRTFKRLPFESGYGRTILPVVDALTIVDAHDAAGVPALIMEGGLSAARSRLDRLAEHQRAPRMLAAA